MRAILVLLTVYGTLPLVLFRPFVGLLLFSWLAYMRPQSLAWGIGEARLSYHVAIVTLIAVAVAVALGREKILTLRPQVWLLLALWGWLALAAYRAVSPDLATDRLAMFSKMMVICLLTTGLVRTYERFRALILVIAFSLGLLGAKYALYGLLRGGMRIHEGPGGFMTDNNGFALALAMAVPLLVGIAQVDPVRSIRIAAGFQAALTVVSVFFTFSRGGMLTLGTAGFLLVVRTRRKILVGLFLLASAGTFFWFSSDRVRDAWIDRATTVINYEEDASAMGRIAEWKTALRISRDYPFFGVGPDNLRVVHEQYSEISFYRVSHNTFFQLLVEGGWPAVALFVSAVWVTLARLERMRRRTWMPWVETYAGSLGISIVAFLVGGSLLDKAYYDLIYHLMTLSVCLEVATENEVSKVDEEALAEAGESAQWRQKPAVAAPGVG